MGPVFYIHPFNNVSNCIEVHTSNMKRTILFLIMCMIFIVPIMAFESATNTINFTPKFNITDGVTIITNNKPIVSDVYYYIEQDKNMVLDNELTRLSLKTQDKSINGGVFVCFDFKGYENDLIIESDYITGLYENDICLEKVTLTDLKDINYKIKYAGKEKQLTLKYDILIYNDTLLKTPDIILDPIYYYGENLSNTSTNKIRLSFTNNSLDTSGNNIYTNFIYLKNAIAGYEFKIDQNSNDLVGSFDGVDSSVVYSTNGAVFSGSDFSTINFGADALTESNFSTGMTIIMRFNTADLTLNERIIDIEGRFYLSWVSNKLRWTEYSDAYRYVDSDSTINTGQWYEVAIVWNTTHNYMFLDGIKQADIANDLNFASIDAISRNFSIGCEWDGSPCATVNISDTFIYNVALSDDEIVNHYIDGNFTLDKNSQFDKALKSDNGYIYVDDVTPQNTTSLWYNNGTWNHIVNSSNTWYINGVSSSKPSDYPISHIGNKLKISDTTSYIIDEFNVWNYSLNSSEVLQLYETYDQYIYSNYTPDVSFISQNPSDLTSGNIIGETLLQYLIYDNDTDLDLAKTVVYYKVNTSTSDISYYINGVGYVGYFNITNSGNANDIFNFTLSDNNITTATYNYDENIVEHTTHSEQVLDSASKMVKVSLLNVSPSIDYGWLEVYANITAGTGLFSLYYCNSSYTTGTVSTNSNCANFYSNDTTIYNHTHDQTYHLLIPFAPHNGYIDNVLITSLSYFVLSTEVGTTVSYYTTPFVPRATATQTTLNKGISWTSRSFLLDLHLHQFDLDTTLYYYACANDSIDNQNCTSERTDLIELVNLNPVSVDVYAPTNQTYTNNTITINWTNSSSVIDNAFSFNVNLVNTDLSINESIVNGITVLSEIYTVPNNGTFRIQVETIDNESYSSFGYSDIFTVDTDVPQVAIITPNNITYNTSILNLSYEINGSRIDSCKYSVNGTSNITINNCENISINGFVNGTNTLELWVTNIITGVAYDNVTFTVIIPPEPEGNFIIVPPAKTVYEKNTTIDLKIQCINNNTLQACGETVNCFITMFKPDTSVMIENYPLEWHSSYYNFTIPDSNNAGDHQTIIYCESETTDGNGYNQFNIEILSTALDLFSCPSTTQSLTVLVLSFIILVVFAVIFYFINFPIGSLFTEFIGIFYFVVLINCFFWIGIFGVLIMILLFLASLLFLFRSD